MNVKSLRALAVVLGVSALLAMPTSAFAASVEGSSAATAARVCTGSHSPYDDGILCLAEPTAGTAVTTFDSNDLIVRPNAQFMLQDQAPGGATLLSPGFSIDAFSHYQASFNLHGQPAGHMWCVVIVAIASDPSWWETPPTCEVL